MSTAAPPDLKASVPTSPENFYTTPSRIAGALQCGLRYWRQYVAKIAGPDKPPCVFFAGDMQHQALEAWGAQENDVVEGHRHVWIDQAPDPLPELLPVVINLRMDLAEIEERIRVERPTLKEPTRSKEFKEVAGGKDGPGTKLAEATSRVEKWFRSDQSPWKPKGPSPLQLFLDSEDALSRFRSWWDGLEERPDIVHTEAKERLEIGGFAMTGVIDAVWLWPDGVVEVIDYKRSAGKEDSISFFVQAATYALTCERVIGIAPTRVAFHLLHEGRRLVFPVRENWTERLLDLAGRVRLMHEISSFPPSFRTCSWCDYVSMCHEHFEFEGVPEPAGETA